MRLCFCFHPSLLAELNFLSISDKIATFRVATLLCKKVVRPKSSDCGCSFGGDLIVPREGHFIPFSHALVGLFGGGMVFLMVEGE